VVDLVAPGVVNTMPEATLRLVAEHGQVPADSVHGHYDESQQVLDQLQRLGIDYDDVTRKLEDNGVATFDTAWQRLGEQLAATLRTLSAPQQGS
jgi:transaldolase